MRARQVSRAKTLFKYCLMLCHQRRTNWLRRNLDDIQDGIAAEDISATDRMIDGRYTLIGRLREFPPMGAPRDDLRFGTHSFVYKKNLALYTVPQDALLTNEMKPI